MSLRGTAWEPERREAIPSVAAPAHRWGLYAAGDDGPVLLATAVERARLEVTRAAMGIAAELRELPRATARTVRGARGETHGPAGVG